VAPRYLPGQRLGQACVRTANVRGRSVNDRKKRREEHRNQVKALSKEFQGVLLRELEKDPDNITEEFWDAACRQLLSYTEEKIRVCPQKRTIYLEAHRLTCASLRKSLASAIKFNQSIELEYVPVIKI
jgi:hypothetical protein